MSIFRMRRSSSLNIIGPVELNRFINKKKLTTNVIVKTEQRIKYYHKSL